MEEVIGVRQGWTGPYALPSPVPKADCYAAAPLPEQIGTFLEVQSPVTGEWETCYVVDCGGVADGGRSWMLRNNILTEVDYETLVRWGRPPLRLIGPLRFRVCRELSIPKGVE